MLPHSELSSSHYCLAQPGHAYIVYVPGGGDVEADLSAVQGPLAVEWIRAVEGNSEPADDVTGGGKREFRLPFAGDAVLFVRKGQYQRP